MQPVLSWVMDLDAALGKLGATALAVGSQVQTTAGQTLQAVTTLQIATTDAQTSAASAQEAAVGMRSMVDEQARAARESLRAWEEDVASTTTQAQGRFKDLLRQLEAEAQNSDWAAQLLDNLNAVQEGVTSLDEVAAAWGQTAIPFEGRLRSVRDLLNEVGPRTGEVQRDLKALREHLDSEAGSLEETVGRLRDLHNAYAQDLADMIDAFLRNEGSLNAVLQAAQDLQRIAPGSEAAVLGDVAADKLRRGRREGIL